MRKIVIKVSKAGDVNVSGGKFTPKEFVSILIESLAFEVCRLKKPAATQDDLFVATAGELCTAIGEHFRALYPAGDGWELEWEVV